MKACGQAAASAASTSNVMQSNKPTAMNNNDAPNIGYILPITLSTGKTVATM